MRDLPYGKGNKARSLKAPKVPQKPPDTNKILVVYLELHREYQGAIPTTNIQVHSFFTLV